MFPLGRLTLSITLSLSLTAGVLPAVWAGAANPLPAINYDIDGYDIISPVHTRHGMVVSAQKLASDVGASILKQGGNAVDAAVATGFALAVVLPSAGNLAGGGFMLVHDAKTGKQIAIDFREMAPSRSTRDMYLDAAGNVVAGKSTYTHQAVGVPGTVMGLEAAWKRYGTMPFAKLLAPAIKLAREGFMIGPELGETMATEKDVLSRWPATRAIFFKGDMPLKAGDRLVQKDLANTLELIAKQGSKAFYEGAIARKLVAEMQAHDGLISLDDLKRYHVVERKPVEGDYHGYHVISMPPPSSGGVHIVQILNMLSHYPLKEWGFGSAQTIHAQAEAMKLAYADRAEFLGDSDFVKVPVRGLSSPAYADELTKKIVLAHATPSSSIRAGKPEPYESNQTTHFAVADKSGNVVSLTYTLNLNFGSGIVAAGTGMLLNNQMDDFSAKAGVPNAFGLVGGDANAIQGGKRPLSSMSPTIVLKDGKPWLVTGAAGGSRIISSTLQTIINAVDFDMNVAEAAVAPRIHHQWLPDELRVEKGINPDTRKMLEAKGHTVVVRPAMARVQTLRVEKDGFSGFADPRSSDGGVSGY
ncbi:gamma-glutamyltransferase [Burkholderiaceae bacterium DAT-1]|nr:gamma-glutamyltransferase [Burkholderiaceae bacterium DAT-1]